METLLLTCLQAQLMVGKINANKTLPPQAKNDLVWEIKQVSPKECKIDVKVD